VVDGSLAGPVHAHDRSLGGSAGGAVERQSLGGIDDFLFPDGESSLAVAQAAGAAIAAAEARGHSAQDVLEALAPLHGAAALAALSAPGSVARLVQLLGHPCTPVQTPILRVLGNLASGDSTQTDVIVEAGGLGSLGHLIAQPGAKRGLLKEACWILSNMAAAASTRVSRGLVEMGAARTLCAVLTGTDQQYDVRREAAWAVCNATLAAGGDDALVAGWVQSGVVQALVACLDSPDVEVVAVALSAMATILASGARLASSSTLHSSGAGAGGGANPYAAMVDEHGGVDRLEALQTHGNLAVYERAVSILERYFGAEASEEAHLAADAAVAPALAPGGSSFVFGMAPAGHDGGALAGGNPFAGLGGGACGASPGAAGGAAAGGVPAGGAGAGGALGGPFGLGAGAGAGAAGGGASGGAFGPLGPR